MEHKMSAQGADGQETVRLEVIVSEDNHYGGPLYHTEGSAAFDLRVLLNSKLTDLSAVGVPDSGRGHMTSVKLPPGRVFIVDTGLRVHIATRGYAGLITPRSSAGKRGIGLANDVGLIDSDYQGPLLQLLINKTDKDVEIADGERLTQFTVFRVPRVEVVKVSAFAAVTARGEGGFGSTGTR